MDQKNLRFFRRLLLLKSLKTVVKILDFLRVQRNISSRRNVENLINGWSFVRNYRDKLLALIQFFNE